MRFSSVAKINASQLATAGLPVDSTHGPETDAYFSLREAVENDARTRSWLAQIVRSGILFVVLFEIAGVLGLRIRSSRGAAAILPFEIFNLVAGSVCLYITWTVWFHYNWRLVVFGFCGLVIAAASYLSLCTGQTEPLLISVILLLVAGGSLMPWNARWQGSLTFLCLSWFGINAVWPANPLNPSLYQLLGLLGASALAYSGAQLGDRYRTELHRHVESLRTTHSLLRTEFVNYIALVEKAGFRIEHDKADRMMAEAQKKLGRLSASTWRHSSLRGKPRIPSALSDAHQASSLNGMADVNRAH